MAGVCIEARSDTDKGVAIGGFQERPRESWRLRAQRFALRAIAARAEQRDTPVHHVNLTVVAHHHVGGLHVAMNYAAAMGKGQRITELDERLDETLELLRMARCLTNFVDYLAEAFAPYEFHDDEGAALVLAQIVDWDDVRMLQLARNLCLIGEFGRNQLFAIELGTQSLDGDAPADYGIERRIDATNSPLAYFTETLEAAGEQTGGGWGTGVWIFAGHGSLKGVPSAPQNAALGENAAYQSNAAVMHLSSTIVGYCSAPRAALVQSYGATESMAGVARLACNPHCRSAHRRISSKRPWTRSLAQRLAI